jgi:hypothetical protein
MVGRALATAIVAAGGAAWAATTISSSATRPRIVPCRDIIALPGGDPQFPYRGYRLVLNALSVPPKSKRQVVRTTRGRWPYFSKAGLVVRAGAPTIEVSVPRKWRSRMAIEWGNGPGAVSSLRIASCGGPARTGHAYAGGFYLRAWAACAPLVFRVGTRKATVRFGLGQRC